jgi:hypothetical protein
MSGINYYYNKEVQRYSTFFGFATAANTLFHFWSFKEPTDLSNTNNVAIIVINNLIKKENTACQREPLDNVIQHAARWSHLIDSDRSLLFDILPLAHFIRPSVSEYAQTTQDKVDYQVYPSVTQVIKAFTAHDFIFHNKNENVLAQINEGSFDFTVLVETTWRIQKN